MTYRDIRKALLRSGSIKRCPVDTRAVERLLERSHKDVKTARRNLKIDPDSAYTIAYNGMLRAGLALMFSNGFRPNIKNKHKTIVRFAEYILGNRHKSLVNSYDRMRRKRNRFIYEPDIPCSLKEAKDAIETAESLISIVAISSPEN